MASNLPSNLHKHTAFRDKPYTHTITFPDGYPMPAEITGEIRRNRIIVQDVAPIISINGQSFTFTYTPEQLAKIQGLSDQYFLLDGDQLLGGSLNVMIGYGDPTTNATEVILVDGNITTVQVDGVEIVAGLVTQVEQAASEVESSRQQVVTDAAQVAADKVVTVDAAHGAIAAKNEAVAARDEVVGIAARKIDNWQVDTMADAIAFSATLTGSAFIEVLEDETQGDERALYFWNTVELQEPLLL